MRILLCPWDMISRNCSLRRAITAALQILPAALLFFSLLLAVRSPANQNSKGSKPIAYFTDKAKEAGLNMMNVFGGENTKKYIIETTGTGVAIFDYDNDGWPDIFIVNGTKLDGFPAGKAPTNHLYHNNRNGTFTDVTEKAGLAQTGWGQGVCVGDYDNDGWEDLYVTYYGKNVLYHNNGNGTFTDVSDKAGVAGSRQAWGKGCAVFGSGPARQSWFMVANYLAFCFSSRAPPPAPPPLH